MVIIILSNIQPLPILSTGEVLGQEYITKETILLSSWVSPNWVLAGRDHECASEDAQGSLGGTAEGQQSSRCSTQLVKLTLCQHLVEAWSTTWAPKSQYGGSPATAKLRAMSMLTSWQKRQPLRGLAGVLTSHQCFRGPLDASASATRQEHLQVLKRQWQNSWLDSPRQRFEQVDDAFPFTRFQKWKDLLLRHQATLLMQVHSGHFPLNSFLFRLGR